MLMSNDIELKNIRLCDAHLHFNTKADNPVEDLYEYFSEVEGATLIINTEKEYVLFQEAFKENLIKPGIYIVLGINKNEPFYEEAIEFCVKNNLNYGLKLHLRLFGITRDNLGWYYEKVKEINPSVVIVDDFLYGDEVEDELSTEIICYFARLLPDSRIVVAHSGGVELLRHVMKTKIYKNVFYDLSLTVNYLKLSSVEMDIKWLVTFMHSRVMLGSDYPDFKIHEAYEQLLKILGKDVDKQIIEGICENTYKKVYAIK